MPLRQPDSEGREAREPHQTPPGAAPGARLPRMRTLFWLVVALQLLVLLGFVGVRELTLRTGQEVVLATVPVDPRDLFRGDYVVLRYEISSLSSGYGGFAVGDTVYVRLAQEGGIWKAAGVTGAPPAEGGPFIRGRVARSSAAQSDPAAARQSPRIEVQYGIESYFVPEGTGRAIEEARGDLKVKVAVDGWGNAAIKELLLDH